MANSLNESQFVEMFLEALSSERGLAKNSLASYLNDISDFMIHHNTRGVSVLSLNIQDLNNYLALPHLAKFKRSTISRKISCLKQFYMFLFSENIIKTNPSIDMDHPKREANLPKPLAIADLETLMAQAKADFTEEGIRNYCILEILYSTGMRVSEVLTLKLSIVLNPIEKMDDMQTILIKGKGNKERLVIFNTEALKALDHYLDVRDQFTKGRQSDYLFPSFKKNGSPTHLTRQMFFIILKRLALAANLDPDTVSPHKIRHSFASHILHRGANLRVVQELLGHSDISSTQIYTKVLSSQAKDLVMHKHPIAKRGE